MSDISRFDKLEEELRLTFSKPQASAEFVVDLQTRLTKVAKDRVTRTNRPIYLRPVWIATSALLLILVISFFAIGPERVYAAVRHMLGYIPGVGLVDSSAPIRVLAEPVEQTRDGVTITVTSAVLTADRSHIEYRVFGVQRSAYPNSEDVPGCMQPEYLRLPDGTRLERSNDYPPVPRNVNEVVLVIPCIGNTLPGKAPENWEIPLRFAAAPADFTVMPVEEVTPTTTSEIKASETTPTPVDTSVTVDQVVETEKGYLLIGKFAPSSNTGEWVQTTGMPVLTDASGNNVLYSMPNNIELPGDNLNNGGFTWAYEFNAAGVVFPITITFNGVVITQADPGASAELTFDAGQAPQPGQEWDLTEQVVLAGHTLTLDSVFTDSRAGYSFNFVVDPSVYGVSVQIEGYTPNGGGGGGGGGLTDGKFSTSLAFAQLPTGKLKLVLSNLTVISDPLTWKGIWSPTTPRTDLPATSELPTGTCINANTVKTLATLPSSFAGKALFYEQLDGSDQWGMVLYNLDGTGKTVIAAQTNWGTLSKDGTKVAYSGQGGMQVYDLVTSTLKSLNVDGYDLHWSTDGTKIAYIGAGAAGVFVIDIATLKSTQVSVAGYQSVIGWSADDSKLYFANPAAGGSAWQVQSVNPNNGVFENLFIIENGSYKAINAVLSPDGNWIAYRGRDNSTVYLAKIDGSDVHPLLDAPSIATSRLVWNSNEWLGVSLMENDSQVQKVILVNPSTCEGYVLPNLHGTLEGLTLQ